MISVERLIFIVFSSYIIQIRLNDETKQNENGRTTALDP